MRGMTRMWTAVAVVWAAATVALLGVSVASGAGPATASAAAAAGTAEAARRVQGVAGAQRWAGPSEPVPALAALWPVGVHPVVVRGWEPPATEYGPGHRGVDLAAAAGAPVRAVAPGRVSFAGRVAGRGVIAVELDGTGDPYLRATYEPVRAEVEKGDEVVAGQVIGTVEPGGSHCPGTACLHWGLLRADIYLNPLSLLPPWLLHRGPSRLLPVAGVPLPAGVR